MLDLYFCTHIQNTKYTMPPIFFGGQSYNSWSGLLELPGLPGACFVSGFPRLLGSGVQLAS